MSDTGYYVAPDDGPGPGVLLLHSWWGLTPFFKTTADRLSDEGFSVLVPDLNFGSTFDDPVAAQRHLAEADADRLARLTLSAAALLQEKAETSRIGVLGLSMGGSLGLWASVRLPDVISAVVTLYGAQTIDFAGSEAAYQLHFADDDHLVSADDAAFLEATIGLVDRPVEVFHYPGTTHWFFESDRPAYQPEAAAAVWERSVAFLGAHLGG